MGLVDMGLRLGDNYGSWSIGVRIRVNILLGDV